MTARRQTVRERAPLFAEEFAAEERESARRLEIEERESARQAEIEEREQQERFVAHEAGHARRVAELRARPATVLAGIDEAGLGPVLGPLTLGYSAFAVRAPLDLWTALAAITTRDVADDAERLVVADSKVVFTRNPRGARRLEATALAFLSLCEPHRCTPADGRALLALIPDDLRAQNGFENEAWYLWLATRLPASVAREELERFVARLREELAGACVTLLDAGMRVLPVCELNASFETTNNKSLTHWVASAAVLRHLWAKHARAGLDLVVDRHGGRMRYGWLLNEAFPCAAVHLLQEKPERSEYFVEAGATADEPARWMRIAFAEKAENASFAVALASCLAKYARETCMNAFNEYFASLQPGLKPTAGYTTDGWRWLEEAREAIERSGVARAALVRER